MDYKSVIKEMKAGKIAPVYFLHGDEPFFMDKVVNFVTSGILTEAEKGFNFSVLYGRDTDYLKVIDIARRYPMMAERQVVILKEAQQMKDLVKLAKYVENPSPATLLLICYKHKKLDQRTAFAKLLKKKAVVLESKKIYENKVAEWAISYLGSKHLKIEPNAVRLVSEYLGNDLSKVANELDKLVLNIEAGHQITVDDIQKHIGISKDYNVFELQQAIAKRDSVKAYRIINYFIADPKNHPIQVVVGALFNFFNKVYVYHSCKNDGDRAAASKLKLRSEWFLKDYKLAANNFGLKEVEYVIATLREFDLRSKGVGNNSTGTDQLLKELIFKLLNGKLVLS